MANDGGTVALIEEAVINLFSPMKKPASGETVFKQGSVDYFKWQIGATEGGLEAIQQHAPFMFISYQPPIEGNRQGGSLEQTLRFAVTIGQHHKEPGVARVGNDQVLGISKMRDIVIAALDKWHPGEAIACNPFYYVDEILQVHTRNHFVIDLIFECKLITN